MEIRQLRNRIATFVAAGVLAASMAAPAVAFAAEGEWPGVDTGSAASGQSGTDTNLYIKYQDTGNMATNNATDATTNFKVQVPVAINYVACPNGTIQGPDEAAITNYSSFTAHVSGIAVSNAANVSIVATPTTADQVALTFGINNGTASASTYSMHDFIPQSSDTAVKPETVAGTQAANPADWRMSAAGGNVTADGRTYTNVLKLTSLGGSAKGFRLIDPYAKTQIGTIAWTIVPGWTTGSQG